MKRSQVKNLTVFTLVLTSACLLATSCSKGPAWKAENDKLIAEHSDTVKPRVLDVDPATGVTSNLQDGQVVQRSSLNNVELAPGVKGNMYWGRGNLVNFVTMDPNAELPSQKLDANAS